MASSETVTVDYATANDTATAGEDYESKDSAIIFESGQSLMQTVQIAVIGDTRLEPDETFLVTLSNPSGATCHFPNFVA